MRGALPGFGQLGNLIGRCVSFPGKQLLKRCQPMAVVVLATGCGIRLVHFTRQRLRPFGPRKDAPLTQRNDQGKGFGLPRFLENRGIDR